MDSNQIKQLLIDTLRPLDPFLVVLFGSYAYGTPGKDSDLDVFIVLNDDTIPATFNEKQALYLSVSRYTRPIARQIPIDLMVFTKPMFEQFKAQKSSFSIEILNKGKILYESDNKAMA
jgi:uncharacterized protein